MVKSEINFKQIEKMVNGLPLKKRAKLLENLQKDTWRQEFRELRERIRARVKKHPISQEEINQTVEEVRQELYDHRRR